MVSGRGFSPYKYMEKPKVIIIKDFKVILLTVLQTHTLNSIIEIKLLTIIALKIKLQELNNTKTES